MPSILECVMRWGDGTSGGGSCRGWNFRRVAKGGAKNFKSVAKEAKDFGRVAQGGQF